MGTLVFLSIPSGDLTAPERLRRWSHALAAEAVSVLVLSEDEALLREAAEVFHGEGNARAVFLLAPIPLRRGVALKWAARHAIEGGFRVLVPASLAEEPRYALERAAEWHRSGAALLWDGKVTAVACSLLDSVAFELADDGVGFDMDLRLQAESSGTRICEVSRGAAEPFAYRLARFRFALHRMGVFCSLKFSRSGNVKYLDKTELPGSTHAVALGILKRLAPRRLLDVGSGPGHFAARCAALGAEVVALDREAPGKAEGFRFVAHDLERLPLPLETGEFDVITALDVVEHLSRPEALLLALRNGKTVLISTPNVAFFPVRLCLALGRFNYAERGILDVDHKRLFTQGSLRSMLESCGYEIERCIPVGVPGSLAIGGPVGKILTIVSGGLARLYPSLFAFQFLFQCKARAKVSQLKRVELSGADRRERSA